MNRRRKLAIGAGVVILIGAVGALSVAASGRDGVAVRVEPVRARKLVATVTANGWIRPHSSVEVQADIMGRIVEVPIEEGDSVGTGDLLLRIEPTQYEAALARARAAVSEALADEAQARANLLQAEQALERSRSLSARDSALVSAQALEEAVAQARVQRALHEAAQHRIDQARAALNEAEDQLAKTVIRAPIDGVVTRLNVEAGETAIVGTMNNPGSLLLTVSDLSIMEAVVRVDETDLPSLELGDSVAIEIDALPRRTWAGRVTEIGHSAVRPPESTASVTGETAQAVDFEVVVTLDEPPPELRPDLSATAEIVTDTRDEALAIPIIALTVREREAAEPLQLEDAGARAAAAAVEQEPHDEEGVFLVRGDTARFVRVEIGIAGREYFEVVAGLEAGDSVIAGPYESVRELRDGARIQVQQPDTAARRGFQR